MNLQTKLSQISGIGYSLSKRLERLELFTVSDLVYHFPFRYDDFSQVVSALEAQVGEKVTLVGEIWSIKNIYTRSRKILTQAVFNDGTTPINLTWFNSSWITKQIQAGDRLQISGKVSKYKNNFSFVAPVWEKIVNPQVSAQNTPGVSNGGLHTGRLVAVYPETFGLTSKWIRTKVDHILPEVLEGIKDPLPPEILDGMLNLADAISKVHFPKDWQEANQARDRLAFDELFFVQLATLKARNEWKSKPAIEKFQISNFKFQIDKFIKSLPFKLTKAQVRVIEEIMGDLEKKWPMNRLVQGDVGSGKTVLAAITAYMVHLNGFKTLYMAPTEILAFQHYSTLTKLLEPFGIKVGIYTGSRKFTKKKTDSTQLVALNDGKADVDPEVIIGTHALLSEKLNTDNVGLIIVDEQQRFGVEQRTVLRNKARVPHFLTMTATPIPRTVALTLYGDLDLSVIDEMPKGRIPVKTYVVLSKKRDDAMKFIAEKIAAGDQVYIITPLIEESETLTSVKAAKVEFERLKKDVFAKFRLGLLHGRLKSKEKEEVINDFKEGKLDILVSTSVVEVGMDVTNATIMVVEAAERFGLAQLHQLRGRVGRGEKSAYCFLFMSQDSSQNKSRLKNLEKMSSGLEISELDLKIRGSGEIFGMRQSGRFEFKIASLSDLTLIEKTREAAKKILSEDPALDKYPQLRVKLESFGSGVMPD